MAQRKNRRTVAVMCSLLTGYLICIPAVLGAKNPRVLVLSETAGWDHQTRTAADSVIGNLGKKNGFEVTATRVSDGFFTNDSLAEFAAVCFINTTGTIFTAADTLATIGSPS